MTTRIATVPGTPLLIPEVSAGAAGDLDAVRAAAVERVAWAAAGTGRLGVLAQDPSATSVNPVALPPLVSIGSLGLRREIPNDAGASMESHRAENTQEERTTALPVSVLVAVWLADAAGVGIDAVWSVPTDPALVGLPDLDFLDRLLLIADGSCTRTPKAPGSVVEGAVEFDDQLTSAIATVDTGFLTDRRRSSDVATFGPQGLGVWALASHIVAATGLPWSGEVDLTADPFGVLYLVGGWQRPA